jgi:virulence factor Mce-like protein
VGPRRPNQGAIAANPVLIGAATALIVVVAVFLSYNANNGLPFVPTYELDANVPNAAGLIRNNEVRIGGARVGTVSKITAIKGPNGAVGARLHLKLDKKVEPLPADSRLRIRPRSPLGLKYVEITRGHSKVGLEPLSTIPMSHTGTPIEIDDFFNMFDEPTRAGSRTNLDEFGNAFAGRGPALNEFFGKLDPLVRKLEPAMRNLMDPRTRWARFFPSLEQAAREVLPVADQQGQVFVGLDQTFSALDGARDSIQAAISGGPPALDVATRELPAQARFVRDSADLFHRFRPAFAHLAAASVQLAPAFRVGEPALRRAPALNERLVGTEKDLQGFGTDTRVTGGITRLGETAHLLEDPLRFIAPAQTQCNYMALFFSNLASALSEADQVGTFLRAGILALPQQAGSEAGPAATPANGPPLPANATAIQQSLSDDSFLHSNPYPNTASPGQSPAECEAANEKYLPGRMILGNAPGDQTLVAEPTARLERK